MEDGTSTPEWNGRFWVRIGCNFTSTSSHACQTGDCQGLLSCNGDIGIPPVTLAVVNLQEDKPSFYDSSVVDGYNLPISVSTKPFDPKCMIKGCTKNINSMCPYELQVSDEAGSMVACRSVCFAFDRCVLLQEFIREARRASLACTQICSRMLARHILAMHMTIHKLF